MDISNITSASLSSLIKLVESRETLLTELKKVENAIAGAIARGEPYTGSLSRRGRKSKSGGKVGRPKTGKNSSKRGALKEQILAALKASGSKGVSVKELSSRLGVKSQNIHVWFATTGKTSGAVKVSPGVYRLK